MIIEATPEVAVVFHWALAMAEARLARLEGDPARAWQLMEVLGAEVKTPSFHGLQELVQRVSIKSALGEHES